MRIAYVTTDEVNHALAVRMADPLGAVITRFHSLQERPEAHFDAILYDLDHVPPDAQRAFLAEVLSGPPSCPKAVHGYGLSEEQAATIRMHGVAVTQRLHPDLIRTLCQAALRDFTTVPPDDALLELTWVNLAE